MIRHDALIRRWVHPGEKTIKCLLIHPNPESALDEEAGKQLLEDYEGYAKVGPRQGTFDLIKGGEELIQKGLGCDRGV